MGKKPVVRSLLMVGAVVALTGASGCWCCGPQKTKETYNPRTTFQGTKQGVSEGTASGGSAGMTGPGQGNPGGMQPSNLTSNPANQGWNQPPANPPGRGMNPPAQSSQMPNAVGQGNPTSNNPVGSPGGVSQAPNPQSGLGGQGVNLQTPAVQPTGAGFAPGQGPVSPPGYPGPQAESLGSQNTQSHFPGPSAMGGVTHLNGDEGLPQPSPRSDLNSGGMSQPATILPPPPPRPPMPAANLAPLPQTGLASDPQLAPQPLPPDQSLPMPGAPGVQPPPGFIQK